MNLCHIRSELLQFSENVICISVVVLIHDFSCSISLLVFPFTAYVVEKLAWQKRISGPVSKLFHTVRLKQFLMHGNHLILKLKIFLSSCVGYNRSPSYNNYNCNTVSSFYDSEVSLFIPLDACTSLFCAYYHFLKIFVPVS